MRPDPLSFHWLLALRELGATAVLLPANMSSDEITATAGRLDLAYTVDAARIQPFTPATAEPQSEPRVVILTSGTTGEPKAVVHSWQSLERPVRATESLRESTWLLTFAPHLYAGLQVFLHVWVNRGSLVLLRPDWSPATAVSALAEHAVEYVSATPSFWRYLLFSTTEEQRAASALRQITLGGESSDQALLDRLATAFPSARIVHIYATTELGRCFSVTDGREGFPAAWLDTVTSDGIELRIDDGELLVRSANAMLGYLATDAPSDAWTHTGDRVNVEGDRVLFLGRDGDIANIGGHKVSPVAVEDLVRGLPDVEDALVYSVPSAIAGQLLGCDLLLAPGADPDKTKLEIARRCAESLSAPMRPRFWNVVSEIPLSPSGKRIRKRDKLSS